jgi:hypothetical protein
MKDLIRNILKETSEDKLHQIIVDDLSKKMRFVHNPDVNVYKVSFPTQGGDDLWFAHELKGPMWASKISPGKSGFDNSFIEYLNFIYGVTSLEAVNEIYQSLRLFAIEELNRLNNFQINETESKFDKFINYVVNDLRDGVVENVRQNINQQTYHTYYFEFLEGYKDFGQIEWLKSELKGWGGLLRSSGGDDWDNYFKKFLSNKYGIDDYETQNHVFKKLIDSL